MMVGCVASSAASQAAMKLRSVVALPDDDEGRPPAARRVLERPSPLSSPKGRGDCRDKPQKPPALTATSAAFRRACRGALGGRSVRFAACGSGC